MRGERNGGTPAPISPPGPTGNWRRVIRVISRIAGTLAAAHDERASVASAFLQEGETMKSGTCLFWIAVGAILTFAVTANTLVSTGTWLAFVIMVIGIIGLVTGPSADTQWLGRCVVAAPDHFWGPVSRVEENPQPPYVLRNPGTANAQANIPDPPSLEPDPEGAPAAGAGPYAGRGDGDPSWGHEPRRGVPRSAPETKERAPGDTEVIEDVYEEPPCRRVRPPRAAR